VEDSLRLTPIKFVLSGSRRGCLVRCTLFTQRGHEAHGSRLRISAFFMPKSGVTVLFSRKAMDKISPIRRSENMRRIRGINTAPELAVRRILSASGVRYRLHRRDLPGRPDVSIGRIHTALFVHGCFWHRHQGCRRAFTPSTRNEFWSMKLKGNVRRDSKALRELKNLGWKTKVIWECETKDESGLRARLAATIRAYSDSLGRIA
jgi:DNA mismatch endonuclease, patch repair protein